jgi:hypothetical protein
MHDEPLPCKLDERTGRHLCVRCLAEVSSEDFLRNDYVCNACAQQDEYPLASTPEARTPKP